VRNTLITTGTKNRGRPLLAAYPNNRSYHILSICRGVRFHCDNRHDGTILKGITRFSVIELAKDLGYKIHEEPIDINILVDQIEKHRCTEAFGIGTAASITPIGELYYKDQSYTINNFEVGPITKNLYNELVGIQRGRIPDRFNWIVQI